MHYNSLTCAFGLLLLFSQYLFVVNINTHEVFNDFLEGADAEDEDERCDRGPAPRGRHVRDLLQQADQQEEAVGVAAELLEQEQRDERGDTGTTTCVEY